MHTQKLAPVCIYIILLTYCAYLRGSLWKARIQVVIDVFCCYFYLTRRANNNRIFCCIFLRSCTVKGIAVGRGWGHHYWNRTWSTILIGSMCVLHRSTAHCIKPTSCWRQAADFLNICLVFQRCFIFCFDEPENIVSIWPRTIMKCVRLYLRGGFNMFESSWQITVFFIWTGQINGCPLTFWLASWGGFALCVIFFWGWPVIFFTAGHMERIVEGLITWMDTNSFTVIPGKGYSGGWRGFVARAR